MVVFYAMNNTALYLTLLTLVVGGCGQSGSDEPPQPAAEAELPPSLLAAAQANNVPAAKHYLEQGEDIDQQDAAGVSALIVAANLGYTDVVRFLLEQNARVDLQSESRQFTVVTDQGAVSDLLAPVVGGTALHEAADRGHLEIVKLLVEAGADVASRTSIGAMPLHVAAASGHATVVEYLAGHGADVSELDGGGKFGNPGPPIYYAAWAGHADVIRVLLEIGAEVDQTDRVLDTPLMVASRRGKLAAVLALLDGGAQIDKRNVNEADMTALIFAAARGHAEVVQALLDRGAAIDAKTNYDTTALSEAASVGSVDVVKVLLQAGADTTVIDNFGRDLRKRAEHNPEVLALLE